MSSAVSRSDGAGLVEDVAAHSVMAYTVACCSLWATRRGSEASDEYTDSAGLSQHSMRTTADSAATDCHTGEAECSSSAERVTA